MTTKLSDAEGLEMDRLAEEEMERREGVTKVRVEGDMAVVQFINLDWAA